MAFCPWPSTNKGKRPGWSRYPTSQQLPAQLSEHKRCRVAGRVGKQGSPPIRAADVQCAGARAETGAGFTARAAQVALQRLRWYLATTGGAQGRPAPPHARESGPRPSILLPDTEKLRAGLRSLCGSTFAPPCGRGLRRRISAETGSSHGGAVVGSYHAPADAPGRRNGAALRL